MALLSNLLDKLSRPPEDLRAKNCANWARTIPETEPIAEVKERQRTKVAGVIRNIRIDPREGSGSVEATIFDGTGDLIAKWLGRRSLSGISLGEGLVVEGIAGKGSDGRLVILNPEYELVEGPDHG